MKITFRLASLAAAFLLSISFAAAQSPIVSKVEPPNWRANHSINPVRVMMRGENLKGASVLINSKDLKAGNEY